MTDQLSLYNGALIKLGQPRLAALTDEGKARRALDAEYAKTVKGCLEAAFWNFAMRFVQLEATPSVETNFGYQYAFDKPDDWLRTAGVTSDDFGKVPLLDYDDRTSRILAGQSIIYLRYVSNDEDYGLDLGLWPQTFVDYVETCLAWATCEEVTGSAERKDRLEKARDKAKYKASNTDAMNEAVTRYPPPGRLVQSRGSSSRSRPYGLR
ncbi:MULTISPECIES: phage connector family protein [unclassified Mesorhizobium]|uniref:hypothetical protein n=1 Tax=unclassified Mesorhizobium TaxID=325217 RepID=UPI0003D0356C|nr:MULTISPECIES: hypothetical protein [unclassified Mesorhizobium]ESZ07177.1 hypothetical protein X736_11025 [Mesorhizobium sp. L2C089B000]WJI52572.1 hypothetical protein NLY44_07850 [Mesorhizobium sp. C089B]